MLATTLSTLVLLSGVAAQGVEFGSEGSLSAGGFGRPAAEQLLFAKGQDPALWEAQSNVTFNLSTPLQNTTTWIWRVTTAGVPIPQPWTDLGMPDADYSANFSMQNTQYQLAWPLDNGNVTLQHYLADELNNLSVGYTVLKFHGLPDNYTHSYHQASNGSCSQILGDDCVMALQQDARSSSPSLLRNLPACSATGLGAYNYEAFRTRISPYNATAEALNKTADTYVYNPIYFDNSQRFPGNLTGEFQYTASRTLNLLVLDVAYTGANEPSNGQVLATPNVLCQIIDRNISAAGRATVALPALVVAAAATVIMSML